MKIIRVILIVCSILAVGVFAISELIGFVHQDTTRPQITAEAEVIEVPCEYTRKQLMEGIYAWDEKEGDLTSQVVLSAPSRFLEKGICNLTYVVFDSANQSATLTRKIKFTDYHSPRFTLTEPLVFTEGEGTYEEIEQRLGAEDMLDGSRKDWIVRTNSDINYQKQGTYTVSYEVDNSFGDTASADLPVHVVPEGSRETGIHLTTGLVYLQIGDKVDPTAYIAGVTAEDGGSIEPEKVTIDSSVNSNVPGCYEIHYETPDHKGETWLTVIVEDEGGTE